MALSVAILACTRYSSDARVRRHAECLATRGDRVHVYSLEEGELDPGPMLDGVRLHGLQLPAPLQKPAGFFPTAFVRFFLEHARSPFDVVYLHASDGLTALGGLLPRISGARVILDLACASREPVSVALLSAVDDVVAADRLQYDQLLASGVPPRRLHILMDAADPKLFPLRKKEPRIQDHLRIVYHGAVIARHGLDLAIRAFAKARREDPRLQLTVIGDGEAVPELRELASSLDLSDEVLRMDGTWRPLEEVATRIRDAHVAVVPHRADNERSELPSKLLEYLSIGIPVVAARTPAIGVYFDDNQLELVPPGDAESMASALLRLAGDKGRRKALVEAGHAWEEAFGFETQKRLLLRLVRER